MQHNRNKEEHIDKLINENTEIASNITSINKNIVLLINLSRKRDKDLAFIIINRNTCFKTDKLSSINYKKLYNSKEQLKETINYLNNLYNVKHIFNSYNHMYKALNALMIEKNFELKHVSESFIYK